MSLQLNRDFLIYIFVGITNTILGYVVIYFCLDILKMGYFYSSVLGYVVGFINGFFLNRRYTFKSNHKIKKTIIRYLIIFICSYILSYYLGLILSGFFLRIFNITQPHIIENLAVLVGAIFYTISSYFGNKYYVFRSRTDKA